jgi:hypothetical protein
LVVNGRFDSGEAMNIVRFSLDPLSVPLSPSPKAVRVTSNAFMCLGCGKIWGEADLKKAREYGELFGTPDLKEKLNAYRPAKS